MDEEIEKLAKSLKNSGLVASFEDGVKKAKEMLSGKNKGQDISVEKPLQEKQEDKAPVKESKAEENETLKKESSKGQKTIKQSFEDIKEENNKGKKPELTEEEKEKTDLTKIFHCGK